MELFYFDQIETRSEISGICQCALPSGGAPNPNPTETCVQSLHQLQRHEEPDVELSETTSSENDLGEEEQDAEVYLLSDEDSNSDGKSVDYGFIIAVTCLLTGISLVAISYTVPRDLRVDPDIVSAREMEQLEQEKARVGAHLDRCVIAGLCLLTLGGALLSSLLMMSMYKSEMMRRRFVYSKHAANLYGSIGFKAAESRSEEDLEALS